MELKQIVETARLYKDLMNLHNDTTLAVTDLEKFLYVYDGMELGVQVGDLIKPGSATEKTILQRQSLVRTFDASSSLYAKDYTSMTMPVLDDSGQAYGTISWTVTTNEVQLTRMAKELSVLSKDLATRAEEFSTATETLFQANEEMNGMIEKLVEQMSTIGKINELIADVSSKSKILGLNATIEAVRAGEFGKSFAVVAKEIEKLASESASSAKEVTEKLNMTQQQIQSIFDMSKSSRHYYEQQAEGSVQIAAAVQQVSATASSLHELSNPAK